MATSNINKESAIKHIRFKHEMIAEIEAVCEGNFSAYVKKAVEEKLNKEKNLSVYNSRGMITL